MASIKNSNVVISSRIGRDVINNVYSEMHVTEDDWEKLTMLAAQHGRNNELRQLRELETLLKEDKKQEAGQVWGRIRGFFESMLPYAANIMQIVGTIDALAKHS